MYVSSTNFLSWIRNNNELHAPVKTGFILRNYTGWILLAEPASAFFLSGGDVRNLCDMAAAAVWKQKQTTRCTTICCLDEVGTGSSRQRGSHFILCIHYILHLCPSQFLQLRVNYQPHSVNTWRVSFHSEYRRWAAMSTKENLWFCLWTEKIWHFPENSRAARGIGSLQWCSFLRAQACVYVCVCRSLYLIRKKKIQCPVWH